MAGLRQAQAEKRLGPGDQVMIGSGGQWQPLSSVLGAALLQAPPPPAATPPQVAVQPPKTRRRDPIVLVAVIAVLMMAVIPLAIVAALLFPVFAGAREKARQASCLSNMRQLNLGLLQYMQDYDERFPPRPSGPATGSPWPAAESQASPATAGSAYPPGDWRWAIYPYILNNQIFLCPTTNAPDSYQFSDKLYGVKLGTISEPAGTLDLFEKGWPDGSSPPPHNRGYNIGFADGHCRWKSYEGRSTGP